MRLDVEVAVQAQYSNASNTFTSTKESTHSRGDKCGLLKNFSKPLLVFSLTTRRLTTTQNLLKPTTLRKASYPHNRPRTSSSFYYISYPHPCFQALDFSFGAASSTGRGIKRIEGRRRLKSPKTEDPQNLAAYDPNIYLVYRGLKATYYYLQKAHYVSCRRVAGF